MNYYKHKTWGLDGYYKTVEECAKNWGTDIKEIKFVKSFTDEEFILKDVPIEFHSVLSSMAYERGHSAGEDECLLILRELVYDLTPAINAFEKRLTYGKFGLNS